LVLKLRLRAASLDDAPALSAFWKSNPHITFNRETMTLELFKRLLASGHTCYAAWLGDEIVGYDWIWEKGFYCRYTGLRLDWPSDTCYAGELWEHDRYRGKGIGLALLAFSLGEVKKKGYARQVFWVASTNLLMLSASMQLFNFEIIGSIRRWGTLPPLSFSTWKTDEHAGHGGTLIL
jgi:GNAT superfamily N-acetyltransferase